MMLYNDCVCVCVILIRHIVRKDFFLTISVSLSVNSFAGQKVVQCYCIRVKRFAIAETVTVGKSEKMERQRVKII